MSSAFAQVLIARVSDAMPLAESVLVEPLATQYKRTIKAMLRKMEDNNPAPIRCTVTTGDLLIQYVPSWCLAESWLRSKMCGCAA
eukprot:m.41760 g.41760  ORF g.41760 m.41760 type:complete len:85 (+) comp10607_c0_seq1:380-634(+)